MKKIKKLLALIMAMTMVRGMAMTVSAAEPNEWKISVENLPSSDSGAAVSIFYGQLIKADPESPLGWAFVDSTENDFVTAWNAVKEGSSADDMSADEILEALFDTENPENANVTAGTITNNKQFAAALNAVAASIATSKVTSGNVIEVKEEGAGLYIIRVEDANGKYSYLLFAICQNESCLYQAYSLGFGDCGRGTSTSQRI